MTYLEKVFFNKIETNRGTIKNKKKFEPIVIDIYNNANNKWLYECYGLKRFGLQFIHQVVTTLNHTQQDELLDNINKYNLPNIDLAKTELFIIKTKYGIK